MAGQPTKIGKYEVLREIGRGGMGKVFGAIDPTIGRMVAIKQVTAVLSDDPDLLKRFYREAQSTGKLQHPNIVTLYDLGEQDGIPYLVMEYLEGDSLEKIIQERRPYTVAEKLNIIIQVCEGLGYAHQRQIIHRDMKPGNIVVLNDGGVKIVDFGIAQFGNERYTRTGQVVGSLYYMSPEQIQDFDIDSRSDIYSTGIVLYEFLTGSVPFRGKDATSTLAKTLHDSPPSVANSVEIYAAELDTAIRRALAKDRNARYTSMEDFAFDLRSLQEKLSQDLIASSLRAAESFFGARQWDKAREQLRQILKLDQQHRRANELLREVQIQIQRQQVGEQVRQLRLRAEEALGMRNWEEALAALDQAIKVDSSNTELIRYRDSVYRSSAMLTDALRRAEAAHNVGDLETAKRAVEEALKVDPYNTTAKALNAILSKEISERSKRKKVDEFVAEARKEIALRHFTGALELLRGAEAMDASAAEVQQLIRSATAGREHEKRRQALEKACGEIEELLNRDEYSAACAKADEALLSFPQDLGLLKLKGFAERQREAWNRRQFLEAQTAMARQLADSGELLQAQRMLNEALERYPDDSGVISLLGIVSDGLARQEAQRREAERQANEKRRYIRMQLETAAALQQAGQTAEALKKVREGLVHYPDSEQLRSHASALEESLVREEALRKRAEEEVLHKRAEIEKAIAESWQLLSSKQTGQAVTMLGQALRRHPESADLKSQLEFAQRRLAVAEAERERAEQEARRKAAEIEKEVASGQRLLDSRQSDQAIAALEQALSRYPDNEELKVLLQAAYRHQAAERVERELAEQALWQKQIEIEREIAAARNLLEAKRTGESVARLQQALGQYPGSEELKQQLEYARQQLAAEETARQKAQEEERRRRAWVDAEITMTRQWVAENQADRAVTKLQQALGQYPESDILKAELESAKRRSAQERAEREQAEKEAQRKREAINQEIRHALELLDSGKTAQAVASLEKAILRFPDCEDLRSQLELAKRRVAEEAAERQRIAEEAQRRQAEIERARLSARQFMESGQTSRAVTALELAFQKYPDSAELKSHLEAARKRLTAEDAERQKVEQENQRKKEEIHKEIATATRLLDAGQLAQALICIEASLRRIPDSEELKVQLRRAKDRLAEQEAAKQRAEQEKSRREAEIAGAVANARKLLDSQQTSKAAAALDLATRNYPESEELHSLLGAAREVLAQERAAQEKAEREAQARRQKIAAEIESAKHLLKTNQTSQALTALEDALGRYPESEELRSQLAAAKDQQGREIAEKQRAEKRQAQIQQEKAKMQGLLEAGDPDNALNVGEAALRSLGKDAQLQQLVESAKAAVKLKKAEEKKRASEREQAEEQKRQRDRDLTELRKIAQSVPSGAKRPALEKLLRKAGDIAARHPQDAEIQQSLAATKSAIDSLLSDVQPPQPAEPRLATKLFTREKVEEPTTVSVPVQPPPRPTPVIPSPSVLSKLLNKWTVIVAVAIVVIGVALKLLIPSKAATYVVNVDGPAGATVQVGKQTCVTPNCRLSLPPGEYQLEAQLSGYGPLSQSVTVDAQNPSAQVKLVFVAPPPPETAGYLVVKAGLAGADVLINGNKRSQTITGGTLRLPLGPGTYSVEVQKKGYVTAKLSAVQIQTGKDTSAEFTLTPSPNVAELVITGATPNVQVLADGRDFGRTDSRGTLTGSIESGGHEIQLEQDGRRSNAIKKSFVAGGRTELEGKLFVMAPPSRPMATVAVTHLPSGALVKVEGGATYGADQSGMVRFDIVEGDHTLEIVAQDYKPRRIDQPFPAGKLTTLDGALEHLDREGPEWEKVKSTNDMAALQEFLDNFQKGNHAQQAESRLNKLIASSQSEQELKAFYQRFPNTPAGEAAGKRMERFRDDQLLTDRAMISDILGKLEKAYSAKNVNEVCGIWSQCPRQTMEKVFKEAASASLSFQITDPPKISEEEGIASLVCGRTSVAVYKGIKPHPDSRTVTIHFRRQGNSWQIDSIE